MLPSEPQNVGGVLDSGFSLYRNTFKSVVGLAAIFAVVMAAANLTMINTMDFEAIAAMAEADPDNVPVMPAISPVFWVLWFVSISLFITFFLSIAHRQWALAQNHEPTIASDITRGLALLIPTLVMSFLYYFLIGIGMILLIIPGLVIMVSAGMFMFVPIVESRGAWFTVRRSHDLVWGGNWWRTAAVFTVLMIIIIALSLAFELILGTTSGLDSLLEPTKPTALASVGGVMLTVIMYPLITAIMLALYNDLLIRKQGGDIDAKLEALDQTSD